MNFLEVYSLSYSNFWLKDDSIYNLFRRSISSSCVKFLMLTSFLLSVSNFSFNAKFNLSFYWLIIRIRSSYSLNNLFSSTISWSFRRRSSFSLVSLYWVYSYNEIFLFNSKSCRLFVGFCSVTLNLLKLYISSDFIFNCKVKR